MTTFILDTLNYANILKAGGYTEQQAETSARALAEVLDKQTVNKMEVTQHEDNLRRDIEAMRVELKHDLEVLRFEAKRDLREAELRLDGRIRETELKLEARISESKAELTRWVVGVGVLQTTVIVAVLMRVAKLI